MNIIPVTARRNNELMDFILIKVCDILTVLLLRKNGFFVVCVRDAFEEKDRNDICLIFILVDRPAAKYCRAIGSASLSDKKPYPPDRKSVV